MCVFVLAYVVCPHTFIPLELGAWVRIQAWKSITSAWSLCVCCMNAGAARPYGTSGRQSVPEAPPKQHKAHRSIFREGAREHSHGASLGTLSAKRRRCEEEATKAGGSGGGLEEDVWVSGSERTETEEYGSLGIIKWGASTSSFCCKCGEGNRRTMAKTHLWAFATLHFLHF